MNLVYFSAGWVVVVRGAQADLVRVFPLSVRQSEVGGQLPPVWWCGGGPV